MFEYLSPTPLSGVWDNALLAPVAEINEQMIECLRLMSGHDAVSDGRATPRLVSSLRPQWRQLDASSQRRLASCPYLLLDGAFSQPGRWDRMLSGVVMDSVVRGIYFSDRSGIALLRRMLVLAWHLARSNRMMAGVILGMNAASAQRIAVTRLRDLEALAEVAPAWIAPRWEQQPIVWQQLIRAACDTHPLALRQAHLRGLQLLARDHQRA
jgi:hypothetical protein